MDPFPASVVPHGARVRSMTEKDITVQRDPLAGILATMRAQPLLLNLAVVNSFQRREVRDRHMDTLLLDKRKRFKRTEQPVFEYSFQFAHHDLIVAGVSTGFRLQSSQRKMGHP
jgi:hypothetical protein